MARLNASSTNCSLNAIPNCTFHNNSVLTHDEDEDEDDYVVASFQPLIDVLPIVLAVLIIITNSTVLGLVYKRRNLRTVTNYMLCSLAISDLLTGLISIPLFLGCNIIRQANVCVPAFIWNRMLSTSTASHLIIVTLDRYVAIIYSLRYSSLVTKTRGVVAITFIWILSMFVSLIQLTWVETRDLEYNSSESTIIKEVTYDVICIVVYVVFSFFFMSLTYCRILYEIVRQSRNIKKNSTPGWQETRLHNRREWKAVTMFGIMLILYIVCWLPYFIHRIQLNLGDEFFVLDHLTEYIFTQLRFFTSMMNPILYVLGKHDFRKALGKSCGCAKREHITYMASDNTRSSLLKTSSA